MASHESIRPEASTIHRGPDADVEDSSGSAVPADDQQLVQAKTVIRGSSRPVRDGEGLDQVERSPASVAKVLLGKRLNHFFLEELIGGGGMGAVFRARDEQLDRVVAIKVIPFVSEDPDLQRRFRNEAQSAAKLDHPRIARVFDVGNDGQWHYIVFEYIRGTNIRDMVVAGGVLPVDDAVFYTCQLAEAIQHAADRGIVHRDIKPSNVLIGDEDKIKLVDMGLARSENFEISEDMTASGVTLGTFDYISPEQARDPRDADLRSDIYSLGCALYFMLTGRPPYPGGTMLQKLLSHGNAPPPDARELREEVSDELMSVIQKMLAKNPDDRYQSAGDLIADLREVAFLDGLVRTQAVGPVAIQEPNPIMQWVELHAPWVVAVALLIATIGWLHLNSVASRKDWPISDKAAPPNVVKNDVVSPAIPLDTSTTHDPENSSTEPRTEIAESDQRPTPSPDDTDNDRSVAESEATNSSLPDSESASAVAEFSSVETPAGNTISVDPLEAAPPPSIRVMGPGPLELQYDLDGAVLTSSFAEALLLADQYDVDHIEIAAPLIDCDPIEITRDNLRITSKIGGSALVFQPDESRPMERSNMLSIGNNRVELEDLHFVWRVPSGEINGGSLFEVNETQLMRLTDCSVTVENPAMREGVYVFDVVTDPEDVRQRRPTDDDRDDNTLPMVAVELNNVIVRGQTGLIHMDFAVALQVSWDNGLLTISDAMIDTSGARLEPPPTSPPIQLRLTRLTSHTPKGLLRMRLGVAGKYPVSIDRFATDSVFVVNSDVPHFEFTGLEVLSQDPPLLQLRGSANSYVTDPTLASPLMVIRNSEGDKEMTRLNDLTASWPGDVSPKWTVYWSRVRLSDASPSRLTAEDYRQAGAARGGFEERSLPILPDLDAAGIGVFRNTPLDAATAEPREL